MRLLIMMDTYNTILFDYNESKHYVFTIGLKRLPFQCASFCKIYYEKFRLKTGIDCGVEGVVILLARLFSETPFLLWGMFITFFRGI